MLRMTIEAVGYDHLKQTVVILKEWDSSRLLPIFVEASQARSIALQLEGATPPRPLSHDLLLSCIQLGGGRVTRVVVNDLQDSVFYATIDIDTPRGLLHIDARPSDAIALAVRVKCPVFVDGGAIDALVDVTPEGVRESSTPTSEDDLNLPGRVEDTEAADVDAPAGAFDIPTTSDNPENPESSDDDIDRFKRLVGDLDL